MLTQEINIFHKFRVSTQPRHSDLIFIIPAFNEQPNIGSLIGSVRSLSVTASGQVYGGEQSFTTLSAGGNGLFLPLVVR